MSESIISIVLIRHGNTFESGQVPVMIGCNENPPLTRAGEDQARALGKELRTFGFVPDKVYSSPLKRTLRTAELALTECGLDAGKITEHSGLRELDYGLWSGLSHPEIEAKFGRAELENWDHSSVQPPSAGFRPSSTEITSALTNLISEMAQTFTRPKSIVWVVSSNGILRFFTALAAVESFPQGTSKMRTGAYSVLEYRQKVLTVRTWDIRPSVE